MGLFNWGKKDEPKKQETFDWGSRFDYTTPAQGILINLPKDQVPNEPEVRKMLVGQWAEEIERVTRRKLAERNITAGQHKEARDCLDEAVREVRAKRGL